MESQPPKKGEKLTKFTICDCTTINIRTFWVTTFSFWICFFVWFGNTNLAPWITINHNQTHLTTTEVVISRSVLTLSSTIFRLITGDLLDKVGSRYCYIVTMTCGGIALVFTSFAQTSTQYIICKFFVGIIGASFVVTEYHTSQFFSDRLIGLAMATAAGWGNFGGGCAALVMPALAQHGTNWRYLTFTSGVILILPITLYYFFTNDSLAGNVNKSVLKDRKRMLNMSIVKETYLDYRAWILFLVYAACFGVEITVITYMSTYFQAEFDLDPVYSGTLIFWFSALNLFARSLGGMGSDLLYIKYGIQGRVYTLFLVLLAESIFLFLFAMGNFSLGYSIVIMTFFSFFVQCAEGVTYAIVPFVKPKKIGAIYGLVAAGGNFGSFLFSMTIFYFASQHQLEYQYAFIILSVLVALVAVLTLKIEFSSNEIRKADDLLNKFLRDHGTKIFGENQRVSTTNLSQKSSHSQSTDLDVVATDSGSQSQSPSPRPRFIIQ